MGGVFAAAAQAPLTAIASVAEMTGNFTLALPIMLACGISAQLAKRITHGSIYTTKLLRRGIDIERPKAIGALQALTVAEIMQPLANPGGESLRFGDSLVAEPAAVDPASWERLVGPVTLARQPQVLFADEDLERARRQLVLYGHDGLPVLSHDGVLRGWLTRADVLRALETRFSTGDRAIEAGATAAEYAAKDPTAAIHTPSTPLRGYEMLELRILPDSPASGRRVATSRGPPGCTVVAITQGREIHGARQTSSCIPVSGRSCSRQPPMAAGRHRRPCSAQAQRRRAPELTEARSVDGVGSPRRSNAARRSNPTAPPASPHALRRMAPWTCAHVQRRRTRT